MSLRYLPFLLLEYGTLNSLQGLDWHGASVIDAFSAVVELSSIVRERPTFPPSWQFPHDTKVVVIGHSNGGQGTWHLAARYPDKVIAGNCNATKEHKGLY